MFLSNLQTAPLVRTNCPVSPNSGFRNWKDACVLTRLSLPKNDQTTTIYYLEKQTTIHATITIQHFTPLGYMGSPINNKPTCQRQKQLENSFCVYVWRNYISLIRLLIYMTITMAYWWHVISWCSVWLALSIFKRYSDSWKAGQGWTRGDTGETMLAQILIWEIQAGIIR